jgi:hypothetical protein
MKQNASIFKVDTRNVTCQHSLSAPVAHTSYNVTVGRTSLRLQGAGREDLGTATSTVSNARVLQVFRVTPVLT